MLKMVKFHLTCWTEVQPTSDLDRAHIQPKYSLGQFFCRSDFSLTTIKQAINLIGLQKLAASIIFSLRTYTKHS